MLVSLPDYVTLVIFRGGKRQDRYATPRQNAQGAQPTQASRPAPQASAPSTRPAPQAATRPAPRPAPVATSADDETPF